MAPSTADSQPVDGTMYTITTRSPTPSESRLLAARKGPDLASLGCLTVMFGVVPILLLGKLGAWVGGLPALEAANAGRWAGWIIGAGIFIATLVLYVPVERRRRSRARNDSAEGAVQEITVSETRVFELRTDSENEPVLAFDLGDRKILFLRGQWLREAETYGAPRQEDDPEDQFLNGFPAPYSFPSRSFTLSRLPHSGRVLGIRVQGAYLAPEKVTEGDRREYEFGDSELFDGELDDIAAVLAAAHAKRSQD